MPQPVNPVFVIEPVVRRYRYLFAGGRTMDVDSPYRADSVDRGKVLEEAHRRWGGKKDDWRIEGCTEIKKADDERRAAAGDSTTASTKRKAG